jgi:thiol-disulfide isomerase/thioredoxin
MPGPSQLALRIAILAAVALAAALALRLTRRYVARQRRLALAAAPVEGDAATLGFSASEADGGASTPRILAFSSPYCGPCHTLQEPALRRVAEALGAGVAIETVDATEHADLAARYHVMTLPATVVFDAAGHPSAVNYGFANAERLLAQLAEATTASRAAG